MESFIPTILENFLGEHRRHTEHKEQISFDCPECDDGKHKGNLEVNYGLCKYKCWSCKELNNMYGNLSELIKKYGSKEDYKKYLLIKPVEGDKRERIIPERILEVPDGLRLVSDNHDDLKVGKIKTYLNDRGIYDQIIEKFKICYTNIGKYNNRVIIPTYDSDGKMEYFVSRAFEKWLKPKYLNPDVDKDTVIFFEQHINWDATIYLVEGVFDAIVIPNAIPLLGKFISEKLFMKLQEKAKADIVVLLDGDAHDDAKELYIKLNVLNLYNRIKIIYLHPKLDVSLINEKYGKPGLKVILKSARKIKESLL